MRAFLEFYTTPNGDWPPLNTLVYGLLLAICWTYALMRGGAPERLGATNLALGSVLTAAAIPGPAGFRTLQSTVLIIDLLCLAAFVILALRADRFWPFWVAALQLLGVAAHGIKFSEPTLIPRTYGFMLAIWSYPMIFLMIAGTFRHQSRLRKFGSDESWSPM
jgi:hypothetical protein